MRVDEMAKAIGAEALTLPHPEREVEGCYVGDLLSWVMGRCGSGDAWVTIMSNRNVFAVASLADVSCVILAEGVRIDAELTALALEKEINVLAVDVPIYEVCKLISGAKI